MMATRTPTRRGNGPGGFATVRSAVIGLSRALTLGITSVAAAPLSARDHHDNEPEVEGASLPVLFVASIILVLLGGAFAGLTIALMGQDSIYLQVLSSDPYEPQSKNAKQVYNLLKKGKHWVLVTLLLSNVIVNETLPVVLDRCLGGGVAAVIGSTVLIVIFGEVVPQSVCVRYGLQIGGFMSKPVLVLMWLMAPIAWPTAKLLDWALGEDHGTVYKKSGLKQLVTLHQSLGEVSERLNEDEVTIISAVLELKEKPVQNVMTPMDDVFVMAEDTVLDEKTMDRILSEGYSRIPIHATGRPTDFVGMLLVKILITYDPEDAMIVREFPLATLPETRPETSCLDIVNFFQEGKSHMVLVSEYPGADHGAIGVVTLEDVIEELIGEEIIDESDVYIDVHKAIRRLTPAPKARPLAPYMEATKNRAEENGNLIDIEDGEPLDKQFSAISVPERPTLSSSPKTATFLMRRSSAGPDGVLTATTVPVKANLGDMKERLKHLGPSNRAANPKNTKSTTVKIKPAQGSGSIFPAASPLALRPASIAGDHVDDRLEGDLDGDEHSPLLARPKLTGKGGVHAVRRSYGGMRMSEAQIRLALPLDDTQVEFEVVKDNVEEPAASATLALPAQSNESQTTARAELSGAFSPSKASSVDSNNSTKDEPSSAAAKRKSLVRSGSITENIFETGRGVQKIVIQAASPDSDTASTTEYSQSRNRSNVTLGRAIEEEDEDEDDDDDANQGGDGIGASSTGALASGSNNQAQNKKKNRRKKRKGGTKF